MGYYKIAKDHPCRDNAPDQPSAMLCATCVERRDALTQEEREETARLWHDLHPTGDPHARSWFDVYALSHPYVDRRGHAWRYVLVDYSATIDEAMAFVCAPADARHQATHVADDGSMWHVADFGRFLGMVRGRGAADTTSRQVIESMGLSVIG